MNEITPFIDGGLTYGVSKAWADGLRLLRSTCPERDPNHPDHIPYLFNSTVRQIFYLQFRFKKLILVCNKQFSVDSSSSLFCRPVNRNYNC